MRHFTNSEIIASLDWQPLVEALREGFRRGAHSPPRPHYTVSVPDARDATLLLMPAWSEGRYIGLKTATVFPDNGRLGLPTVTSYYMLMSAKDGRLVATLDGGELTARRTAAASALASSYLSRPDSSRLLIIGTGKLSPNLAAAHAAVRPIEEIAIWGRDRSKAEAVVGQLAEQGIKAAIADNLEQEVRRADIVSCATLSTEPLVRGAWLRPGIHLDLVGAFTPTMREADDEALRRARVFLDTQEGAMTEAGEIVQAMASGALQGEDIQGDLFDLARGDAQGRSGPDEITLFKSVGCSLEDLVAAELCFVRCAGR
ncbi:ornithine cyclodeaminase family protein [Microvirga makkahensis]|uniref:Ornithine cyclodeaminase family protein n=1 Tax=Microvirga makkahensis TaxID=1128670 RepID=A0A7X3SQH3_9HYPH|nr:ornithine cyclodeaminase family protein [Microvirga makkahensis]MXQ13517.1 ornithine cyclodeaminase family protein [Microvirga makkahensis]